MSIDLKTFFVRADAARDSDVVALSKERNAEDGAEAKLGDHGLVVLQAEQYGENEGKFLSAHAALSDALNQEIVAALGSAEDDGFDSDNEDVAKSATRTILERAGVRFDDDGNIVSDDPLTADQIEVVRIELAHIGRSIESLQKAGAGSEEAPALTAEDLESYGLDESVKESLRNLSVQGLRMARLSAHESKQSEEGIGIDSQRNIAAERHDKPDVARRGELLEHDSPPLPPERPQLRLATEAIDPESARRDQALNLAHVGVLSTLREMESECYEIEQDDDVGALAPFKSILPNEGRTMNARMLEAANGVLGQTSQRYVEKGSLEAFKLHLAFLDAHGEKLQKMQTKQQKAESKFGAFCEANGFRPDRPPEQQLKGHNPKQIREFTRRYTEHAKTRTEFEKMRGSFDATVSRQGALKWQGVKTEAKHLRGFLEGVSKKHQLGLEFDLKHAMLTTRFPSGSLKNFPEIPSDCDQVIVASPDRNDRGSFLAFKRVGGDDWECTNAPQGFPKDTSPEEYGSYLYGQNRREISVILARSSGQSDSGAVEMEEIDLSGQLRHPSEFEMTSGMDDFVDLSEISKEALDVLQSELEGQPAARQPAEDDVRTESSGDSMFADPEADGDATPADTTTPDGEETLENGN